MTLNDFASFKAIRRATVWALGGTGFADIKKHPRMRIPAAHVWHWAMQWQVFSQYFDVCLRFFNAHGVLRMMLLLGVAQRNHDRRVTPWTHPTCISRQ